jgi:alpha-beta hydrolase superfamily lysophospholipase
MTGPRTPVVFIHGLWLHATSSNQWLDLYCGAGYEPVAPGWPGEPATVAEARVKPELVANTGIDDAVAHYTEIIAALDTKPIIVGHSFGGLLAEKLLGQDLAVAAVAIDPAQIKGVLPLPLAQLRAALPAPAVRSSPTPPPATPTSRRWSTSTPTSPPRATRSSR